MVQRQHNERLGSQWKSYCKQPTAKRRQLLRKPAGNTEICDEIHGNHILPCVGGDGDDNRILMGYSYQPKEVRVELFGWRLSRKQIIFVLAGGVVVGSVWWRKNKGKTQK